MVAIRESKPNNSRIQDNGLNLPPSKDDKAFKKPPLNGTQGKVIKKPAKPLNIKNSIKKASAYKPAPKADKVGSKSEKEKFDLLKRRAMEQMMFRVQNFYQVPKAVTPIKELNQAPIENYLQVPKEISPIREFHQAQREITANKELLQIPKIISPIKELKVPQKKFDEREKVDNKPEKMEVEEKFDYSLYEVDTSFLFITPKTPGRRPSLKMKFKKIQTNAEYKAERVEEPKKERMIDDTLRQMIDNYANNIELVVGHIQKEKRLSLGTMC